MTRISTTSRSYSIVETSCPSRLVKGVDHEMKPEAGFLYLAEELQFHILTFLSCRDILRCTSVCKALRQMYMSSSELQYIVELGGQGLLPVSNTDDHTPAERLQLLRDRSHAWFKVDIHSSKTISIPDDLYYAGKLIADGHLYLWNQVEHVAMIIPIPPKPSQHTRVRLVAKNVVFTSHTAYLDIFMDPAQNLIVITHAIGGGPEVAWLPEVALYVDLEALDGGGVHPQAAGPRLFLRGLPGYEDHIIQTESSRNFIRVDVAAQIWDWQHSTTSNSVLAGTLQDKFPNAIDFCFLGNNRLLVATEDLKIYSFEDISQKPQLLACFMMPVASPNIQCLLSMDDIAHSPQMQTTNTSDPKHRLLCLTTWGLDHSPRQVYIISTRIFFDLDGMAAVTPIPWEHWGPSNARIFQHSCQCKVHVSGNRVLLAFTVGTPVLHLMDFSPLAVTNRRGLGRVMNEPSMIDITDPTGLSRETLTTTTSLPYVEVVLDKKFRFDELENIWIDKDRIYLVTRGWTGEREVAGFSASFSRLEVIDV
ncbi:hypothetical protein EV702DRAFT_1241167 [Suillus placidus]|uniref:F-box domain-containing protein n=1 Tax=Suillus placidus TaxID=48579 RepID=A0A9P6ZPI4_9AGAM|nr:hypothetical protein EV702DRAFT_1241167 [Suillus placidus]